MGGREQGEGGREGREGGSDDDRQGESVSGGTEGRGRSPDESQVYNREPGRSRVTI